MTKSSKPVHILTGFLGTGKTTLLNQLLDRPDFSNTLVIVNEFGEIGLDHHLIESSAETIVELSNGCLCCSIRGDLVDTLLSLDTSRFSRIIIETTGIANPLPIHQALTAQPVLATGLHAGSIITVFDSSHGEALVDAHEEARHQLALADIVFLSMLDCGGSQEKAEQYIFNINPLAEIVADQKEIRADRLDQIGNLPKTEAVKANHSSSYNSLVLEADQALPVSAIIGFLHHLENSFGPSLLRVKGFAKCLEHPDGPVLIQMSGQIVHNPVKLNSWPNGEAKTRLVVIGKNLDTTRVKSIFNGFFGIADIDTPDRDALANNPLSIPGV